MQVHAHPFWTMQTPVGWATKAFKNKALVKGTKAFKADPGRIKAPRLQPYASEAATLCRRLQPCNPMCQRLRRNVRQSCRGRDPCTCPTVPTHTVQIPWLVRKDFNFEFHKQWGHGSAQRDVRPKP